MIGHISSDYVASGSPENGLCTKYVINSFASRSIVFFNPGNSQISLGVKFWEDELHKIDVLQLKLSRN